MKKRIIPLLIITALLLCVCLLAVGCGGEPDGINTFSDGLTYSYSEKLGVYTVTGMGKCKDKTVYIPAKYKDKFVRYIGDGFADGNANIQAVVIPHGIYSIGDKAFYGCTSLTELTLPTTLGGVSYNAFLKCDALETIRYAGTCDDWCKISTNGSNNIMSGAKQKRLFFEGEEVTQVTITTAETVPAYAFYRCAGITEVTLGDSVTSIGSCAFKDCSDLKDLTVPSGLTYVGEKAFTGCPAITVNEYESCLYVGNESNPHLVLLSPRSNVQTSYTIHKDTTLIARRAFKDCIKFTGITIPDGVKYINDEAFKNCTALAGTVTVPRSVDVIGIDAFDGCNTIENFVLTKFVGLQIGRDALPSAAYTRDSNGVYLNLNGNKHAILCDTRSVDVTSFTFHPDTEIIGEQVFYDNSKLTSITFTDRIHTIMKRAFYHCENLTSVRLPSGLKILGDSAFSNCERLASVGLPSGLQTIDESAFYGCKALTSITIPDSVTTIGDSAFASCSELSSIKLSESLTAVPFEMLLYCYKLETLVIPDSVTAIAERALPDSIDHIILGSGVKTIGAQAIDTSTKIYYRGTRYDWRNITHETPDGNSRNKRVYYYSESEPNDIYDDSFWHYAADGSTPVEWPKSSG